jgi:plasmid stabilization system protein ParE
VSSELWFHPLVQRDLNEALGFHHEHASRAVAERFEMEVREALAAIARNPRRHPFYLQQRRYRRCKLITFPHLILFTESSRELKIMVLKHVKQAPGYGLGRR